MPLIRITSKSRPERSDATHPFMRAANSATKRREAADKPDPEGAGTSPSDSRTERANLRVETLISIVHGPLAELVRYSPAEPQGLQTPTSQTAFLRVTGTGD